MEEKQNGDPIQTKAGFNLLEKLVNLRKNQTITDEEFEKLKSLVIDELADRKSQPLQSDNQQQLSRLKKTAEEDILQVDRWVKAACESGLFNAQKEVTLTNVMDKIKHARCNIESDPIQSNNDITQAADYFFKAVDSTPIRWRFFNMYAAHIWIHLISFLSLAFVFFYFTDVPSYISSKLGIAPVAIYATSWGVIGGILQGLWWLWVNIDKRRFRRVWTVRFISTPFIGGIMGAIVYFIIYAGLFAISQGKDQTLS